MSLTLTARARTQLKARAHHLKPIVRVGHAGLSEAFVAEVDRALADHELIKVRIDGDDRQAREAAADEICARTESASVQRVGKILVLWRPKPADEKPT
jgi:RNA-binding protein